MANIASGWVTFNPASPQLVDDIESRIKCTGNAFNYEGEAEFGYAEGELEINFNGRWTCSEAWDFIDTLLSDQDYQFRLELVASEINGRCKENWSRYFEGVKKKPGKTKLKRVCK